MTLNKGTNEMHTIYYNVKNTTAKTTYLTIDKPDMDVLQSSILGLLTYLTEMSISRDKQVKDFIHWFITPDKRYHYNKKTKQYNSPQSYLAGLVNNMMFGTQNNLSLIQLQTIQDIINFCVDVVDAVYVDKGINLQDQRIFTKIYCKENMWVV